MRAVERRVCDSIGSDRSWSKGVRVCCGGTVCVGGWVGHLKFNVINWSPFEY